MDPDQIVPHAKAEMQKAYDHTLYEFSTINTGKASPGMVEHVQVEAYGTNMPLNQTAAISTPDAKTISITPFDKSLLKSIEKAIQVANLGLQPIIKGDYLVCPLPEMNKERRQQLAKQCHDYAEKGKVGVRAARRDAMDAVKAAEKAKSISEDDRKAYEKDIQKETDDYVKKIDAALKDKESELMKV